VVECTFILSEASLKFGDNFVLLDPASQSVVQNSCKKLQQGIKKRYGPEIGRVASASFLKKWANDYFGPSFWGDPDSQIKLKKLVIVAQDLIGRSFQTSFGILSAPGALFSFSFLMANLISKILMG